MSPVLEDHEKNIPTESFAPGDFFNEDFAAGL